ncbi:ABC transporter ATP-binding protein [Castellaniella sp.]|uniref:ABC transporter ATP-binding protein n=1 Tax=Castellaniella sp. TaxID=1955812 RepID=UPI0035665BF8
MPNSSNEVLVSFRQVQKSYDGTSLVVVDLNLDIYKGEFLSLLGPSGSGKTTSLMMLAGFEEPSGGTITLQGRDLHDVPPHSRNLGMVFQNYALFPHMTLYKNIEYPLKVRKMPTDERRARVQKALDMVEMGEYANRYPGQISGGQKQRIALARALVFEPSVVLMDEPLGALDKKLRERMQLELKDLHKMLGITFLYVTHDQSEALTMSDRIAIFNHGVIQQVDVPEVLYEEPRNRFVAGFMGDSIQIEGVLTAIDGDYCTVRLSEDQVLRGLNVHSLASGTSCVIAIRPERVTLTPNADNNHFIANFEEDVYQGDHIRAQFRLSQGGDKIFVKIPLQESTRPRTEKAPHRLYVEPCFVRVLEP